MTSGVATTEKNGTVSKTLRATANLSDLKAMVAAREPTDPLRAVVMRLPKEMPTADFAALVPTLWSLVEQQ